jgi:glycosyltransferase involved in cell wall biosynthesis
MDSPVAQSLRNQAATEHASQPLVSFCITAHNYGRFLQACIESVLGQSYPNIECIVVDDGSTDETSEILKKYESKITVCRHDTARGHFQAFISGAKLAKGQFITFVDADDLLYPHFAAINVAAHLSSKAFVAITTSLQHLIDADGHLLGTYPILLEALHWHLVARHVRRDAIETEFGSVPITVYEPGANYRGQQLWGTTSSLMFRRQIVSLLLPESFADAPKIWGDNYLTPYAHRIGGSLTIEAILSAYRRHTSNGFADNVVIGGRAPITTGRKPRIDAYPVIGDHLDKNRDELLRVLGRRKYLELLDSFCPRSRAKKILFGDRQNLGLWYYLTFLMLRLRRHVYVRAMGTYLSCRWLLGL